VTSLNEIRAAVQEKSNRRQFLVSEVQKTEEDLKTLKTQYEQLSKAQEVFKKAAQRSQESIMVHLSGIVTKAIQTVIGKPYKFHVEFVERRGVTEADLYVTLNGNRLDILESAGGGLADVCSFALKVAYLILSGKERVLVIDEVARHLNSSQQREAFARTVKELSKEFGIQLILNTTVPEFVDIGDQVFHVTQKNGVSNVVQSA